MSTSSLPTHAEILTLTAYLPKLYVEGISLVEWKGETGQFPYPVYARVVKEFYHLAGQSCWCDYEYEPKEAGKLLQDADFICACGLNEIKTLLTYCVRGERFTSGHWAAMIEQGYIHQLLERLMVIAEEMQG